MLAPVDPVLIQALHLDAPYRIADVACGGGGTTLEIFRRAPENTIVHGFDISPTLIEVARSRTLPDGRSIAFKSRTLRRRRLACFRPLGRNVHGPRGRASCKDCSLSGLAKAQRSHSAIKKARTHLKAMFELAAFDGRGDSGFLLKLMGRNESETALSLLNGGTPEWIRTTDLLLRRQTLTPDFSFRNHYAWPILRHPRFSARL